METNQEFADEEEILAPQPGPQTQFLCCPADIVLYGGSAGGGKSWSLLLDPLRHCGNRKFKAVIFRRETPQITNPGGLWDEASAIYPLDGIDAVPIKTYLEFRFPSGATVKMAHLEHEDSVKSWQGSAIAMLAFDELTHFTRNQFFYMLSRNRSMCGIRPYVRATTNPDSDSWVAEFIAWWIDQNTGYAIPERGGVIRWFIRLLDQIIWADTREELIEKHGKDVFPKSFTFIPSSIHDNKKLLDANPEYLGNLNALQLVERERLLKGNWKIRPAAGLLFRREWCEIVDAAPASNQTVRYWDLAATEKTSANDPDWTVGVRMSKSKEGIFYVEHVSRMQKSPGKRDTEISNTASADGRSVKLGLPQDPGQAGKSQAQYMIKDLVGLDVSARSERGPKVTRFSPFSAQAEAGNVKIVRGAWNAAYLDSLEGFPDATHDDDADATAGAFNMLITDKLDWSKIL